MLAEIFVNGVVYAHADISGKTASVVNQTFPLGSSKTGQFMTANMVAYQSVDKTGIKVVASSDGAYGTYFFYIKTAGTAEIIPST